MQAKNHVLVGEGPARVGAKAPTFLRGVISNDCGGRSGSQAATGRRRVVQHARVDAVGESINQAEDFVVPETGIKGDLSDEIGRGIGRVAGGRVVAIAGAPFAQQEVVRVAVRGERALRVFNGESDRHLIAEVFRYAK